MGLTPSADGRETGRRSGTAPTPDHAADLVYLTPDDVARILQVHPRTVLRLAEQDATMPATRLGPRLIRFEKTALYRWLARKRPRLAQQSTQTGPPAA
jgi:excisionase family DNA binding protein